MNRLFTRIMAVVLTAILVLTVAISVVSYFTLRSQRINARLDYLVNEAEDIAHLARSSGTGYYFSGDQVHELLNWKATTVYEEFGAYIAVVDKWGNVIDNLKTAANEDPDFVAALNSEELIGVVKKVMTGETVREQTMVGDSPMFTVGVPYYRRNAVNGAVIIQTKVQRIESGMEDLMWSVGAVTLAVLALSALASWFCVRSLMKPLKDLTGAAAAMGGGDFSVRVDENEGTEEVKQLSRAFNTMSGALKDVENNRREFVANVSHELRSPITSILGFAEGMAEGVIPQEEHPAYLRLVADESRRLSHLVGELLTLSRLEREDARPEYSVFDINEMLRRAIIRRMNDLDEKNIATDCDFGDDACLVRADSARVEEVIVNLMDNAIKFSAAEGGKILLSTRMEKDDVIVTVFDNGKAIPEEDREKIFERFFTSDRAHTAGKGTGLGLSISSLVLRLHGRELVLLTDDEAKAVGGEEGVAFRFTLERGKEEA